MTPPTIRIRVLQTVAGTPTEMKSGLLAWLTIDLDGTLILDGLTLRRTVDGRHCVSFPLRRDPKGNRHVLIQPVDSEARRRVEAAILEQLGLDATSPPPPHSRDGSPQHRDLKRARGRGGES